VGSRAALAPLLRLSCGLTRSTCASAALELLHFGPGWAWTSRQAPHYSSDSLASHLPRCKAQQNCMEPAEQPSWHARTDLTPAFRLFERHALWEGRLIPLNVLHHTGFTRPLARAEIPNSIRVRPVFWMLTIARRSVIGFPQPPRMWKPGSPGSLPTWKPDVL